MQMVWQSEVVFASLDMKEIDIYANSQGTSSIQNQGKTYTNTVADLIDENKKQKIELDGQRKFWMIWKQN